MRSVETRRSGLAGPAGLSSISAVSRSGPRTRSLLYSNPQVVTRDSLLSSGDVRAAIYPKINCRPCTAAGAKKTSILKSLVVCRPIPVGRPVEEKGRSQKHVHIHAICCVTPDHALPVHIWDHYKAAVVVKNPGRGDA